MFFFCLVLYHSTRSLERSCFFELSIVHESGLDFMAYIRQFLLACTYSKHDLLVSCFGVHITSYSINRANRMGILPVPPPSTQSLVQLVCLAQTRFLIFIAVAHSWQSPYPWLPQRDLFPECWAAWAWAWEIRRCGSSSWGTPLREPLTSCCWSS